MGHPTHEGILGSMLLPGLKFQPTFRPYSPLFAAESCDECAPPPQRSLAAQDHPQRSHPPGGTGSSGLLRKEGRKKGRMCAKGGREGGMRQLRHTHTTAAPTKKRGGKRGAGATHHLPDGRGTGKCSCSTPRFCDAAPPTRSDCTHLHAPESSSGWPVCHATPNNEKTNKG